MGEPFFSIITVCYNSSKTIKDTFESILNQEYKEWFEYIVIDGCSIDGTVAIIKKYEARFIERNIQFKWISERDNGIFNAMNKGLEMANGKYIGILNSDDTYTVNALNDVKHVYDNNQVADIYHGLMRFLDKNRITMIRGLNSSRLNTGMIEHPTCFVSKETYKKYGGFDERYNYIADYDLMLRMKRNNVKFCLIESIIANFNENGSGNCYLSRKELLEYRRRQGMDGFVKYLFSKLKIRISERKR